MKDKTKEQLIAEINMLRDKISKHEQERKKMLSSLFSSMKDIILEIDYDGKYLDIVPTSVEHMYMAPEDVIGKTLGDIFPKEQAYVFLDFVRRCIDENKAITIEYPLTINNKEIWFEGRATPKTKYSILYIAKDVTEQRQAKAKLEKSYNIIKQERSIFEEGHVVIFKWLKTKGWPVVYVSPNVVDVFGYSEEEFASGKASYPNIIFSDDFSRVVNEIKTNSKKNIDRYTHDPYRITRKDGKVIWVDDFTTIIRDKNGSITHYIGYVVDITPRIHAEERFRTSNKRLEIANKQLLASKQAIKLSEEKYRKIFENAPIGIATIDRNGNPISLNAHILNILGSPSLEASRKINILTFRNLIESGFSSDFAECVRTGKRIKNSVNYTSKWDNSRQVKYILSPMFDNNKKITHVQVIFEDITEQNKMSKALAESEKTFRSIFDNAVDAIYVQDPDGTFIDVNQGVVNMYGYEKDELIGKSPKMVGAKGMNNYEAISGYVHKAFKGEPQQFEFWGRKKNGDIFPKIVRLSNGYYFGKKTVLAFAVDISDRKKAEEILQKQNKEYAKLNEEYKSANKFLKKARDKAQESERLKTAFLQNVSHEIRTPMNGILGFTGLLKTEHITQEEQQSYIDMIITSSNRMLSTIHNLMDISKLQTGQIELIYTPANLNSELLKLLSIFNLDVKEKMLTIKYTPGLPDSRANIYTDHDKVKAILSNLIRNAIKYTHKGSIEFGYRLISKDKLPKLEFYIKDTGIGIPNNRQKAIFDRFVQADIEDIKVYEGAGLGLSISKEYVQMLGGEIWVTSNVGFGAEFFFTIPYNYLPIEDTNKTEAPVSLSGKHLKKIKILIAEDDTVSDSLLTITLGNIAYKILHAKTGVETVKTVQENVDIDLILMDMKMPILNGYDATKQIREFNKDVTIIAQTAYALAGDRQKSIDVGCNYYIQKPINKDELLGIIEALV